MCLDLTVSPLPVSQLQSKVVPFFIPGSKSHTIRALLLAALAKGESIITNPLKSDDTESCVVFLRSLGIFVEWRDEVAPSQIIVRSEGIDVFVNTQINIPIDLGNSGTTLYFATGLAALNTQGLTLDGDASLRTRSATPLLRALETLGAKVRGDAHGCVPYTIGGEVHSGEVSIICSTSQYLSSLILLLSLLEGESIINAELAGEHPYVAMTIQWLKKHHIMVSHDEHFSRITVSGGGTIKAFQEKIPGDFSSAAFFLGLSAITGCELALEGLQDDNTQADMVILDILEQMGCCYQWREKNGKTILHIQREGELQGGAFDLSASPDLLPILSIVAAYASTPTRIHNVAHARKKETDRIFVMRQELSKLGVQVEEKEDGIIIVPHSHARGLSSGTVLSHDDHRVAMAFAIGAVGARGDVSISNAQVASITFPRFFDILKNAGVKVR